MGWIGSAGVHAGSQRVWHIFLSMGLLIKTHHSIACSYCSNKHIILFSKFIGATSRLHTANACFRFHQFCLGLISLHFKRKKNFKVRCTLGRQMDTLKNSASDHRLMSSSIASILQLDTVKIAILYNIGLFGMLWLITLEAQGAENILLLPDLPQDAPEHGAIVSTQHRIHISPTTQRKHSLGRGWGRGRFALGKTKPFPYIL